MTRHFSGSLDLGKLWCTLPHCTALHCVFHYLWSFSSNQWSCQHCSEQNNMSVVWNSSNVVALRDTDNLTFSAEIFGCAMQPLKDSNSRRSNVDLVWLDRPSLEQKHQRSIYTGKISTHIFGKMAENGYWRKQCWKCLQILVLQCWRTLQGLYHIAISSTNKLLVLLFIRHILISMSSLHIQTHAYLHTLKDKANTYVHY